MPRGRRGNRAGSGGAGTYGSSKRRTKSRAVEDPSRFYDIYDASAAEKDGNEGDDAAKSRRKMRIVADERKVARKAKRKAKRKRQRLPSRNGDSQDRGEPQVAPELPLSPKPKKKKKKNKKKDGAAPAKPNFAFDAAPEPEDQELEYLERKLGLGKGKKGKNQESAWSKLEKEFAEDGFHPELASFVKSLTSGNGLGDPLSDEDDGAFSEAADAASHDGDAASAQAKNEEETIRADAFLPKRNLYGQEPNEDDAPREAEIKPSAPAKRRPRFFGAVSDSERLRRRVTGLLNRITEDNANPVCKDIAALYATSSSRRDVNEAITKSVILLCSRDEQTLPALCRVMVAAVVGVDCLAARTTDLRPHFLEAVAVAFRDAHAAMGNAAAAGSDDAAVPKTSYNMALLLCNLYVFNVVSAAVIFDVLMHLTTHAKSAIEANVGAFSLVLDEVGYRLRADDPERLGDLVLAARALAAEAEEQSRLKFMVDCIEDLRANKQSLRAKHESVMQKSNKLRKWIKHAQGASGQTFTPLRIGLDDLFHAEERGRWWIVGGVWTGRRAQDVSAAAAAASQKALKADAGGIRAGLALSTPKLQKLAQKFRMNTDIKRAVFFSMMTAADYEDAFAKLLRLNLNDRQERTIVHVIFECCGRGKTYNPFFAYLAQRLCSYHHRFKFTFQLSLWDAFKRMDSGSADALGPRHAANLASLFAYLSIHFSLSLAVLKVLEFTNLGKTATLFLHVAFERILLHDAEKLNEHSSARQIDAGTMTVAKTFNRIASSRDGMTVRDSIALFFHRNVSKVRRADEHASLWRKRIKVVKRVLDALEANASSLAMAHSGPSAIV